MIGNSENFKIDYFFIKKKKKNSDLGEEFCNHDQQRISIKDKIFL